MKARYTKAFLASVPIGALIGLAFGFAVRGGTRVPLLGDYGWISRDTADAIFWAFAGVLIAGAIIYIVRLLHSN